MATYRNETGKILTTIKWLPNAGFGVKGKWMLRNKRGITCQLSERELSERGYELLTKAETTGKR